MRVVDGDTLKVWITDEIQTVRLIGVDTPATVHPTKEVQRGGKEASAFTQAMLDRKTVRLEALARQERRGIWADSERSR